MKQNVTKILKYFTSIKQASKMFLSFKKNFNIWGIMIFKVHYGITAKIYKQISFILEPFLIRTLTKSNKSK